LHIKEKYRHTTGSEAGPEGIIFNLFFLHKFLIKKPTVSVISTRLLATYGESN